MAAGNLPVPGLVIDAADLDAKLITIRMRGTPHFTGGDMDLIQKELGKGIGDLDGAEQAIAAAYIYLRRAGVEGASWEMARDCAIEYVDVDPTSGGASGISPPSAATGGAPRETSTG